MFVFVCLFVCPLLLLYINWYIRMCVRAYSLTLDENLEELVKMISQDPDSDSEDKVKFKYV